MDEQYYRVKVVAVRLGVSRQTVDRRFRKHPRVKLDSSNGKRCRAIMLIPESAVREYLEK